MKFYNPLHFTPEELVPPDLFKLKREDSLIVFDPRILWTIDKIREFYNKPIFINDWDIGGKFTQRGFRNNIDPKTPCSQHYFGRALDFTIKGVSAKKFRDDVRAGKLGDIMQYVTRIEDDVSWCHIDCANAPGTGIIFFKK